MAKLFLNKYMIIFYVLLALYGYHKFQTWQYEKEIEGLGTTISALETNILTHQKNNKILKDNVDTLTDGLKVQGEAMIKMRQDMAKIKEIQKEVDRFERKMEKRVIDLDTKFDKKTKSGKERDLGKIATKKTKLIEKLVNRASDDKLRCFEILTGAELTEKEKKENYVNRQCKFLFN